MASTSPSGTSTPPPLTASAILNRGAPLAPPPLLSYPARDGHDQFYGYGRANTNRSVGSSNEYDQSTAARNVW